MDKRKWSASTRVTKYHSLRLLCRLSQWPLWYGSLSDEQSGHLLWEASTQDPRRASLLTAATVIMMIMLFFFFRISARLLTLLKGFGIGLDLGRHAGRCWDFRQVSKIKAKKMFALYWFFYRMMLFHKTEFCTVVMMSLHVVMYSNWFINNNIWAFKWSKAYKVV